MATSGSTDFKVNRDDIIRDALFLLGVVDQYSTPDDKILTDCSRMLNMLIKHWQMTANLWVKTDVPVTLTPGTASYTVGTGLTVNTARPMRLVSARRKDTSGREVPIEVFSREDYMSIPLKTTQGATAGVYYERLRDSGVLYAWPTGDTVNASVVCTFRRPIEDFDAAGNNPDIPVEGSLTLVYNLAKMLLPIYPSSSAQMIVSGAEGMLLEWQQDDEENTGFRILHYKGR